MDIRVLRYFLALAQEESISGAAEYLHLTQPTLSRQLMDLETELGKKLFIRGGRKITLTNDGLLLRKRAGEIISLVEKTESEFRETDEDIVGDIYIGGGETDAMRLIAHTAKKLQDRHPHICYHLFSGNADDVTERLDKGLLDFGILIEPADMKKYDYIKLPALDCWGILMRKDNPLAEKEVIKPKDLWKEPIIISQQTFAKNDLLHWLRRDFSLLNIAATYNLLYNALLMVEEGMGSALCLKGRVHISNDSNLCFRPLEPKLEVGLDIVWKKYQVFSKAAELFLSCLNDDFTVTVDDTQL